MINDIIQTKEFWGGGGVIIGAVVSSAFVLTNSWRQRVADYAGLQKKWLIDDLLLPAASYFAALQNHVLRQNLSEVRTAIDNSDILVKLQLIDKRYNTKLMGMFEHVKSVLVKAIRAQNKPEDTQGCAREIAELNHLILELCEWQLEHLSASRRARRRFGQKCAAMKA